MEHVKIENINLQYFELWASNLVDNINYDLSIIAGAVTAIPPLNEQLTNMDASPIQYFSDELNKMIDNINKQFEAMSDQLKEIENRLTDLGG